MTPRQEKLVEMVIGSAALIALLVFYFLVVCPVRCGLRALVKLNVLR